MGIGGWAGSQAAMIYITEPLNRTTDCTDDTDFVFVASVQSVVVLTLILYP
jgi:hypothetical protein